MKQIYIYKKNGQEYLFINLTSVKINDVWYAAYSYQNIDPLKDPTIYTRLRDDFELEFELKQQPQQ